MAEINNSRKVGFAVFIIALGGVLLLDNLDIIRIDIPYYFVQWYTFLLLLGLFLLFVRENPGPGLTLIVIGGLFMIGDIFYISIWSLWPLLLIGAGVAILVRKRATAETTSLKGESPNDIVDEVTIFSGTERLVTSKNFKGGKLSTIFGGVEIDLSQAELAEGSHVIDIFTLFGGSSIYVPSDMNVQVKVTSIFGGYSDERSFVNPEDDKKMLLITGTVLFGGGEVKTKHVTRT